MSVQSKTITFPKQYYSIGKYVQLVLDVDYNNYTNLIPYDASYFDLLIEEYGSIKLEFRIDDYLLVPSAFSVVIGDVNNNFELVIFPDEDVKTEITAKLFINDKLEFEGKNYPLKTGYTSKRKIHITFRSNTNILNETHLYDSIGNEKNPIGLQDGVANTTSLNNAIHDCYKLINPNIELVVNHNWQYYGNTHYINQPNLTINNGVWDELYTDKEGFYNGNNLADTLKFQAKKKFAFTGCLNNSKAFFQRLYYYDPTNVQSLNIISRSRGNGFQTLEYVASKNTSGGIIHELPNADAYTTVQGKYLEIILDIEPDQNYNGWIYRNGVYYYIETIKDPLLNSNYYSVGHIHPELHYYYRNKEIYNRLDSFIAEGLEVDYLKNFTHNNRIYQILSMEKIINQGNTSIEALYLGTV